MQDKKRENRILQNYKCSSHPTNFYLPAPQPLCWASLALPSFKMHLLFSLTLLVSSITALAVRRDVASDLQALVSTSSAVSVDLRARWNDVGAPTPNVIVNVTSEKDVAAVVKYCVEADIPFLAQNGGNGWATTTFNLGTNGVLINLAGLNAVTISKDKKQAVVGGGAIIGDTIAAADAAGVLVLTGNCNCVGTVGALLGGGYGNIMGEHGFGVDNLISLRVVTASGSIVTASAKENPDLFWAMRGAGPNFGIVTSATMNAISAPSSTDRTAWIMALTFSPDQITDVAQAINDLPLTPQQVVYLVLTNTADNTPAVLVTGFLHKGTDESGRQAFAPLFALNPLTESASVAPYTSWNAANDAFCARGDRKPAYSTTIKDMQAETWSELWSLYTEFQAKGPNSAVLIERYNLTKAASVADGATALNDALRKEVFASAIVIPWYTDEALDGEAEAFAETVRDIWSWSERPEINPT